MRIETSGDYSWRIDLYDDAADVLDENTRSGALDASTEFTRQMIPALQHAVEHEDMTEELAEILTTNVVNVEYHIERGVSIHK